MSLQTWNIVVAGKSHEITADLDPQSGRVAVRVNGRMAARPMSAADEECIVQVDGARYILRRLPENEFDLDLAPPDFTASAHPGAASQESRSPIKKVLLGLVVLVIVSGLVRNGWRGFQYMQIDWKSYAPPDASFRINFPGEPKKESETENINGDIWKFTSLETKFKEHQYVVEYGDLHMVVTRQDAPKVLARFFDAWQSEYKSTIVTREETSIAASPAIRFISKLPKQDKLLVDAYQHGVAVIHNRRLYLAWAVKAENDPINYDIDKFLESFELTRQE